MLGRRPFGPPGIVTFVGWHAFIIPGALVDVPIEIGSPRESAD
jgi:hypothetical protein